MVKSSQGHRKDRNHDEIVQALREAGYQVADTHSVGNGFPDIVVSVPGLDGNPGLNLLMELKTRPKLSEKQVKFFSNWTGQLFVVTSAEQALSICDYYRRLLQSPPLTALLNYSPEKENHRRGDRRQ